MSTTLVEPLEAMQRHIAAINAADCEHVAPGTATRFTEAAQAGDGIWQGDLGLEIVDAVPYGYTIQDTGKPAYELQYRQLVPGTTAGARHCLDSLEGVTLYYPANWGLESMTGPVFSLTQERTVEHPVHGNVTIPAGFTVKCRYQRELDAETRRARRAAD